MDGRQRQLMAWAAAVRQLLAQHRSLGGCSVSARMSACHAEANISDGIAERPAQENLSSHEQPGFHSKANWASQPLCLHTGRSIPGGHFQDNPYGFGSVGDERTRWTEFKAFRDAFRCPACDRTRL